MNKYRIIKTLKGKEYIYIIEKKGKKGWKELGEIVFLEKVIK